VTERVGYQRRSQNSKCSDSVRIVRTQPQQAIADGNAYTITSKLSRRRRVGINSFARYTEDTVVALPPPHIRPSVRRGRPASAPMTSTCQDGITIASGWSAELAIMSFVESKFV